MSPTSQSGEYRNIPGLVQTLSFWGISQCFIINQQDSPEDNSLPSGDSSTFIQVSTTEVKPAVCSRKRSSKRWKTHIFLTLLQFFTYLFLNQTVSMRKKVMVEVFIIICIYSKHFYLLKNIILQSVTNYFHSRVFIK